MLVLSYFSNQEILVATSAAIPVSLRHSPRGQSGERASRVAGAVCPAVGDGVGRRLAACAIGAGQTSGMAAHPAHVGG